ncbi:MAG TPA: hypothetical protein VN683_04830 [Acidothermaceae bacterium]|nr:hypothetical protein [Acidothermaceae bacterium]
MRPLDAAEPDSRVARPEEPIALGALGPEVLTYDLVREVLRDQRFTAAHGLGAEAQGITAGSLWQRIASLILAMDGERHHRQRRLVARAFTPRAVSRLQQLIVRSSPNCSTRTRATAAATSCPMSPNRSRLPSSAHCWAHRARTGS